MIVYVLSAGDYDDYHIVGIFSTKEKAEKYQNSVKEALDCSDIEVWDVDDFENLPKVYTWSKIKNVSHPEDHEAIELCTPALEYAQLEENKGVWLQAFGNSEEEVEQLLKQGWEDRYGSNN